MSPNKILAHALSSAALVCVLAPASAQAQSANPRVGLSLNANLLSYEGLKLSASGSSASVTSTAWGPGAAGLGLGVGYGADSWLVGMQLSGNSTTSSLAGPTGSSSFKQTSYLVLPRAEYVFQADAGLKPYVGGALGLRGVSGGANGTSSTDFVFGGVAGFRAFVSPTFSIDPGITLLGSTGKESALGATFDRGGFVFLLGVSLSGWIETSAASAPPSAAKSAEAAIKSAAVPESNDDGTVRAEISTDGGQLRLVGRPTSDGTDVVLILAGAGASSGLPCAELHALVDGAERPVQGALRHVPGSGGAVEIVVDPTLIEALSDAEHSASLTGCGGQWALGSEERKAMRKFFEQFRESAQRYGRWLEKGH